MSTRDAFSAPSGFLPVRLVTFNVRYIGKHRVPGEEPWAVRCPRLCAQLRFVTSGHSSTFICFQEVLYSQLLDIQAGLGPSWDHIGRGRDDGKNGGEFSPIFFQADNWACERDETFWLSETPNLPSRGWDAALPRVVTMGSFRHEETATTTTVMSTHFDYQGVVAREESAHLLLRLARSWTTGSGGAAQSPLFLGGDFNSQPNSRTYKILTSPGSGMKDISDFVPEDLRYGNRDITYTTFGEPGEKAKRIDYLFVLESQGLKFSTFGILPNRFDDGVYLSDHRAVVADVEIPIRSGNRC